MDDSKPNSDSGTSTSEEIIEWYDKDESGEMENRETERWFYITTVLEHILFDWDPDSNTSLLEPVFV